MRRIVFLCPFARIDITGGIKTVYRHAELLAQSGLDAWIWQPDGKPAWFESTARILNESHFSPSPEDVLVFPETLNGVLAELVQADLAAKKVLYCQNHYYALFNSIAPERMAELRFDAVACQSRIAQNFIERVLHLKEVKIVPCVIDTELFRPRQKRVQIAFIPRKLPRESAAIHRIFRLKYPAFASTAWIPVEIGPNVRRRKFSPTRPSCCPCPFSNLSDLCRWKRWHAVHWLPVSTVMADANMRLLKTAFGCRPTILKKPPMRSRC